MIFYTYYSIFISISWFMSPNAPGCIRRFARPYKQTRSVCRTGNVGEGGVGMERSGM